MSHHKRKRSKNARAGCLMCKPNKMSGWPTAKLGHVGFGKIKAVVHSKADLRNQGSHD